MIVCLLPFGRCTACYFVCGKFVYQFRICTKIFSNENWKPSLNLYRFLYIHVVKPRTKQWHLRQRSGRGQQPRAVVLLVNIFNCFAYDWRSKKNETLHYIHDPKWDDVRCECITKENSNKYLILIVLGLTRSGARTIYRTRGKHANNDSSDAVPWIKI